MADGSFYNYVKGSNESNYFGLYCDYTYTQSISGNYTDVKIDVYLRYYSIGVNTRSGTITVGGTSKFFTSAAISNYPSGGGGKTKLGSQTIRVAHNSDGKKTGVKLSVSWGAQLTYSSTYYSTLSASKTVDLPTIPRASTIDSLTCSTAYFDGTLTYKYTPQSASFYNKCNISLNVDGTFISVKSISLGKQSASQKTATVTLTSSELTNIYKELPQTSKGTLRFTLRTYSDSGYSTQVGSAGYKEISLTIPTSVKPTLGTIIFDPVDITTVDGTSRNILVKGKNKLKISVSGCAAGSGSEIKSYTFSGPGISSTKTTTDASSSCTSSGAISDTGSLKYTVKITDKRGRTATGEKTITNYDYSSPVLSAFNAYRCDSSGNADDNGTNIKYSFTANYASVNSTNKITVKIYYRTGTSGSWTAAANALTASTTKTASAIIKNSSSTAITFSADSTYSVYTTVTDNYSGSVSSSIITIFGASRILNIRPNGNGIAFGKMAESDDLLECKWPAKFDDNCEINGGLKVGVSTQSSTPTTGIAVHDVRNADITPDSFGDKNVNFYFDSISGRWYSIMHIKGWTGNYSAWELAGNANETSVDNSLRYRQGIGDTWGDWQTVLTNENLANYASSSNCLPLSGGTLTGTLTLPNSLYYTSTSSTAGINMNNSDIINANAIYFKDASDSAGESINFYRGSGTWDSLYAYNGALRFHPNRGTSTALGGYRVYDGSYLQLRRSTATLSSSNETTVTFSSEMPGVPTVMLTPLTSTAGVIPGKVTSVSSTGFTAIIGGSAVTSAKFAYLAIYYG